MLETELTSKWFKELPEAVKKQFNIKTVDELRDSPLRSFTGFLIKADGGRDNFWQSHGQTKSRMKAEPRKIGHEPGFWASHTEIWH